MKRRAIGIDFSGARNAGRRIWIAEGRIGTGGRLRLERCIPAATRLDCSPARETTLSALATWIASQGDAVVGCDFPFSLPGHAIDEKDWHGFASGFAARHRVADDFRTAMRQRFRNAASREPKRRTDAPDRAATPWNPWNIRLYRQTHAGIASLLLPLIGRAAIVPFDRPAEGRPILVETCPASSLKALGLYRRHGGYKTRKTASSLARGAIVDGLIGAGLVAIPPNIGRQIVADPGGDALDAVIAALGAIAALPDIDRGIGYDEPLEGWVYYVRPESRRSG